ncbi:MAG: M23 family metallopeptidase [Cyclobacteriaceae bacterium]
MAATASDRGFGNVVLMKTSNDEYLVFAHLMKNSIVVKESQKINQGDPLAQCGNSGNSTEPHLHFQMQNIPDMVSPTGAFIYFSNIKIDGQLMEEHMPLKGQKVSN